MAFATASVDVTNTGDAPGSDVVQLYLRLPAAADAPFLQLKAFTRTATLAPGATASVALELDERAFSVWDSAAHAFQRVVGQVGVSVGASACDLRVEATLLLA